MFFKKVEIEFIAANEIMADILEKPYPAKLRTPEWFAKTSRYIHDVPDVDQYGDPNSTIKKCLPVIDALGAGYHIPLYCDLWMENAGELNLSFKWSWEYGSVVTVQKTEQHSSYPVPFGYYPTAFKFLNPWIVKTPPGWSTLFIHPQHHEELPFRCLSGLVDTDKFPAFVHFPFFLKKGFNGLIPKQTPMIQAIPIKRENFKASYSWDKGFTLKKIWNKAQSEFFERYQRHFRQPKSYGNVDKKESKGCPFGFGG